MLKGRVIERALSGGGFIRSYISWEFIRLTVSNHINALGTIRLYAKLENPIMGKNSTSNSNFSKAMMADI